MEFWLCLVYNMCTKIFNWQTSEWSNVFVNIETYVDGVLNLFTFKCQISFISSMIGKDSMKGRRLCIIFIMDTQD